MNKRSKLVVLMALLAVVGALTTTPSQTWATSSVCGMSFCGTVDHCWENCPSAVTAACVNNECQYTVGSGGPGGGGQDCPSQRICADASHCVYGSIQGSCINNLCVC